MPSRGDNRLQRRFARTCSIALCTAWALLSVDCETIVPRHGWSADWGPMVPHTKFPRGNCGLCHVSDRWDKLRDDFSFDHEKETGYALEGAHATAACLRCHNDRGPVSSYVSRGCGGCHPDPHKSTLGLDCQRCHDQRGWRPGGLIAEHARTRFPLYGAHVAVPCERCHTRAPVGDFQGAPVECDLCHQSDLARATSPDHVASGWTTRCERCHTPVDWSRASFRHEFFPVTGGHSGLSCTQCHTSGTFGPIPSDCFSCHRSDYESAPNHVAQQYPTDCARCHRTTSWTTGFIHRFPLRGPHDVSCTTCHQGGFSTFTCLVCHEHSQALMDEKHRERRGYSYDSQACYRCHPGGRGD
jgi:hypothetical protein